MAVSKRKIRSCAIKVSDLCKENSIVESFVHQTDERTEKDLVDMHIPTGEELCDALYTHFRPQDERGMGEFRWTNDSEEVDFFAPIDDCLKLSYDVTPADYYLDEDYDHIENIEHGTVGIIFSDKEVFLFLASKDDDIWDKLDSEEWVYCFDEGSRWNGVQSRIGIRENYDSLPNDAKMATFTVIDKYLFNDQFYELSKKSVSESFVHQTEEQTEADVKSENPYTLPAEKFLYEVLEEFSDKFVIDDCNWDSEDGYDKILQISEKVLNKDNTFNLQFDYRRGQFVFYFDFAHILLTSFTNILDDDTYSVWLRSFTNPLTFYIDPETLEFSTQVRKGFEENLSLNSMKNILTVFYNFGCLGREGILNIWNQNPRRVKLCRSMNIFDFPLLDYYSRNVNGKSFRIWMERDGEYIDNEYMHEFFEHFCDWLAKEGMYDCLVEILKKITNTDNAESIAVVKKFLDKTVKEMIGLQESFNSSQVSVFDETFKTADRMSDRLLEMYLEKRDGSLFNKWSPSELKEEFGIESNSGLVFRTVSDEEKKKLDECKADGVSFRASCVDGKNCLIGITEGLTSEFRLKTMLCHECVHFLQFKDKECSEELNESETEYNIIPMIEKNETPVGLLYETVDSFNVSAYRKSIRRLFEYFDIYEKEAYVANVALGIRETLKGRKRIGEDVLEKMINESSHLKKMGFVRHMFNKNIIEKNYGADSFPSVVCEMECKHRNNENYSFPCFLSDEDYELYETDTMFESDINRMMVEKLGRYIDETIDMFKSRVRSCLKNCVLDTLKESFVHQTIEETEEEVVNFIPEPPTDEELKKLIRVFGDDGGNEQLWCLDFLDQDEAAAVFDKEKIKFDFPFYDKFEALKIAPHKCKKYYEGVPVAIWDGYWNYKNPNIYLEIQFQFEDGETNSLDWQGVVKWEYLTDAEKKKIWMWMILKNPGIDKHLNIMRREGRVNESFVHQTEDTTEQDTLDSYSLKNRVIYYKTKDHEPIRKIQISQN